MSCVWDRRCQQDYIAGETSYPTPISNENYKCNEHTNHKQEVGFTTSAATAITADDATPMADATGTAMPAHVPAAIAAAFYL